MKANKYVTKWIKLSQNQYNYGAPVRNAAREPSPSKNIIMSASQFFLFIMIYSHKKRASLQSDKSTVLNDLQLIRFESWQKEGFTNEFVTKCDAITGSIHSQSIVTLQCFDHWY
eukprot:572056_1